MVCSIQSAKLETLAKTVGAPEHEPDPQLTTPIRFHRLFSSRQTSGPPESPCKPRKVNTHSFLKNVTRNANACPTEYQFHTSYQFIHLQ